MTFTVALMIAVSYWGARDIQTPCHAVPTRISYQQMAAYDPAGREADMRADIAGCRVLIGPFGNALRHTDDPEGRIYCQDVVHEIGHIDGLTHAYDGVMRADVTGHVPWACDHVKTFLRRWRTAHSVQ